MQYEIKPSAKSLPEVEITLKMSAAEFAVLRILQYRHLGGHNDLRKTIQKGFEAIQDELPPSWRKLIEENSPEVSGEWFSSKIAIRAGLRVFS